MLRTARFLAALIVAAACASTAPPPLRLLVYNIHAGRDAAGVDNLERVASLIRESAADIVLLQEVDRHTARSGNVDQLAVLMRRTGMHGAFGKSLDYQGGDYGIATLSRWPIGRQEIVPLRTEPPQPRAGGSVEPRIAFLTVIESPYGPLTVFNTHFDASREETYRLQETEALLTRIRAVEPLLVGGDFNAEPRSRVHARLVGAGLRDAWLECGRGDGRTFSAATPVKRIDYLFLRGGATCTTARVLRTEASDHLPLVVTIE
ncbi:MAG TPA: endonuclease/exonuclease/phosphatase family protein [Thermoanaerobaculia bacterium]|nr:endonuclease/exonuclease/phosphatase family protein [Thermoanaerobaculia bacterium]